MCSRFIFFPLLLILMVLPGLALSQETVIMPLGDSITDGAAGSTDDTGYRRSLFLQLTGAGHAVEFVGSQTSGIPLDFDRDHEGHGGWRADQIRDNIYNWLTNNPANIVLLHIGTNDISGGNEDVQEVADILNNIDLYESNFGTPVKVLLARIILRGDSLNPETLAFNDAVEAMALLRIADGDDIVLVDQENALIYPDDLADAVHPNNSGYGKMADEWFAVLDPILPFPGGVYVSNVMLEASSPGQMTTDDLICTYTLGGEAIVAATAWTRDGTPLMTMYYPFEGGINHALNDYSGSGFDGTAVGDPAFFDTAGHDGHGCLVLDGNDYLDAGDCLPTGAYTKSVWVYWTPGEFMNNILSGDSGHALWVTSYPEGSAGSPVTEYFLSAGHSDPWRDVKDTVSFPPDQWVHVAVTYDPAVDGGTMILYRDGAEVHRTTGLGPNSDPRAFVGAFNEGYCLQGSIDDARIYDRALSSDQISALFASANLIVAAETVIGDNWQAQVIPFSWAEVGTAVPSNTITIQSGSVPHIENLSLVSWSGNDLTTDHLICSYDLAGSSVTAATAWLRNGAPEMSAYLPMEGGINNARLDFSESGNHGTLGGDPTWTSTGGHDSFGYYQFDGDDYISLGNPMPAGGAYTKDIWVYWTPGQHMNNILSGDSGHALWVTSYPEGGAGAPVTDYYLSAGHSDPWRDVKDTISFPPDQWVHVTVTYDPAVDGGTMILFRNGAPVDFATGIAPNSDTQAFLGAFRTSGPYLLGHLDEARIYQHALSIAQVGSMHDNGRDIIHFEETEAGETWQVYVTGFSDSQQSGAFLSNQLTIQDGPALENVVLASTSGNDIPNDDLTVSYDLAGGATTAATAWTLDGTPLMTLFFPFEGGVINALYDYSGSGFNGIAVGDPLWYPDRGHDDHGGLFLDGNDYVDAGDCLPTGAYTKSAWVYWEPGHFMNNILSGDSGHALWVTSYPEGGAGSPVSEYFLSAGHSDPWRDVKDTGSFPPEQWVHVAVTYDPAVDGGTMILYRNGAEVDRTTGLGPNSDTRAYVGAFNEGNCLQGYLDDTRIYARALSSDQIAALFADGNTIVATETEIGDTWQAQVTPFSASLAGPMAASENLTIRDPSAVGEPLAPSRFMLHQNVPNPFNPMTVIKYDLPLASRVSVKIFDLSGRLVTVLKEGDLETAGRHQVTWRGRDLADRPVAAGVYFYRLEGENFQQTRRMILVK